MEKMKFVIEKLKDNNTFIKIVYAKNFDEAIKLALQKEKLVDKTLYMAVSQEEKNMIYEIVKGKPQKKEVTPREIKECAYSVAIQLLSSYGDEFSVNENWTEKNMEEYAEVYAGIINSLGEKLNEIKTPALVKTGKMVH